MARRVRDAQTWSRYMTEAINLFADQTDAGGQVQHREQIDEPATLVVVGAPLDLARPHLVLP